MAENEKARLYRLIVQRTDDAILLERMRLYGFWPRAEGLPADPADEAAEWATIEKELAELRHRHSVIKDPEKALAEERRRRWEESKKRRAARKVEREENARKRRQEYEQYRKTTLVHAGIGVSAGLQNDQSTVAELESRGLPVMHRGEDLAKQLGIEISTLRWLTYHRQGATVVHYHRYEIAKKTGGVRAISAPKPALARAQRWILENILARLETSHEAHGFVRGRSILSNATPHAGKQVVVNLDVKDFFPSITFRRVKGLFRRFGYSEHLAVTLALLCTEPPRVQAEYAGKVYHVALGDRVLPQGACTSPAITNAICRRLDSRLTGLARKLGFDYTRYADDLSFSGEEAAAVGRLVRSAKSILEDEGFTPHPRKTQVMRRGRRQEVTGVIVNQRPTVSRREVRRLRAILHNAMRHGLKSQNRDGHPNFLAHLRGRVALVCMVDPKRGRPLRTALEELLHVGR